MFRAPSGSLSFVLGDTGVGMGFESPGEIGPGALYVLGPGSMRYADAGGQVPLFGLAADSVRSVDLVYGAGDPLHLDGVDGGFVLLVQPQRKPREIVGFDGGGEVVERKAVDYIDWPEYIRPSN